MNATLEITANKVENINQLKGRRVAVLGAARSGVALASLLHLAGAEVLVSDVKPREQLDDVIRRLPREVSLETGGHSPAVLDTELIAISPGIPPDVPILQEAREKGIPVLGEIEIASWFVQAPIVAVTGSNGKTTTTSLIGEILKTLYRKVVVAGNIGNPLSAALLEMPSPEIVVLEVSSFQLETIDVFHPRIAVFTNLSENHLDRYPDYESYIAAKMHLFDNMNSEDLVIFNQDDTLLRQFIETFPPLQLPVSLKRTLSHGAYWVSDSLYLKWQEIDAALQWETLALKGPHNRYNIAMAALVGVVLGVPTDAIYEAVSRFQPLPHRLEFVARIDDVAWYNDSKATTVASLASALRSFDVPIVLIAGGKDKGGDFAALRPLLTTRVKAAVLLGQAAARIAREWEGAVEIHRAESLEAAVEQAGQLAAPGEVVVLAPGCSSFDMFRDYEDRGDQFKQLVLNRKTVSK